MSAPAVHADAVAVLTRWTAPDRRQEELRTRFLDLLGTGRTAALPERAGPHLTASALVVDPAAKRVLLCLHRRIGTWMQLGGHLEPEDATLAAAALREAGEESGLSGLTVSTDPIGLDVHEVSCRYGPGSHYDVRYAVLAPPGAVEVCSAESLALGWFAPDALPAPLAAATEPLVRPALRWARS